MIKLFNNRSFMGLWAGICLLMLVMWEITPLCADDLWYLVNSHGKAGSWEYFMSTVKECARHWTFDTGRLCNFVSAPFLSLFPKWVYGSLSAVILYWIFKIGLELGQIPTWSLRSGVWILGILFVFPWSEQMYTIIYSINYIWGLFWGLLTVHLLIKGRYPLLIFFVSLITGWWHEGISVMLVAGIFTWYAVRRNRPTATGWSCIIGLCIGILIIFLMPAFHQQLGERTSNLVKSVLWETLVNILVWNCMYYIYTLVLLAGLAIRRTRECLQSESGRDLAWSIAIWVAGTVSTIIYLKYYNGSRTGAFCQMICLLGIIRLIPIYFPDFSLKHSPVSKWIVLGCFILGYANMGEAIRMQMRLTQEYEDVVRLAKETGSENPEVYYDVTPIKVGLDFLKPTYFILNTNYGLQGIKLLPERLKHFKFVSPKTVQCSDTSLYLYHNVLVYKGKEPEERFDVKLILEDGTESVSRTRTRCFVCDDGDTAVYVLPHAQVLGNIEIRDASIVSAKQ